MLKLLMVTLGTWSVVSLLFVSTLGFLLHFKQQSAPTPAVLPGTRRKLRAGGRAV
jgi:nitrate reductase NapE component